MAVIDQPTITLQNGVRMPQLGLGVWRAKDGAEVCNAVRTALHEGYRLIDTAAVYRNEAGVGDGIRSSEVPREDIFVTTKLWNSDQGTANVRPALEASLERLGLDYVDLYLIHWPMPKKGLYVETWKEMEKLVEDGLVRSIGVSNFSVEHLEKLRKHSDVVPSVNQVELHPRFPQKVLRDYCQKHGIQVESWSPLGGQGSDLLDEKVIHDIAQDHGKTPAQVVIRWHLQNDLIVIPKSTHEQRIKQNFDVFDFELSDKEMAQIDALETGQRKGPDPDDYNLT